MGGAVNIAGAATCLIKRSCPLTIKDISGTNSNRVADQNDFDGEWEEPLTWHVVAPTILFMPPPIARGKFLMIFSPKLLD